MSKVAELEDALQRERVDKVERLQVMQRVMVHVCECDTVFGFRHNRRLRIC